MTEEAGGSRHSALCLRLMQLFPRVSRGMRRWQDRAAPKVPAPLGPRHVAALEQLRDGPVTVSELASRLGLTLYYYSEDKPHSGKSACTGVCATAWPPLAAPVKAPAGARLPGRLGVITRPNGVKQVTLNGYPLYFYIGDKAPGQAKGDGISGSWHVIKIKAS